MNTILMSEEEFDRRLDAAVARILGALQQKPAAAAPAAPRTVRLLEIGPLIGRPWGRTTAREVTLMAGFPEPLVKGCGARPYVYPGPPVLAWLEQHIGILPPARPARASNDAAGADALPCA